jgi:hypothetical protein
LELHQIGTPGPKTAPQQQNKYKNWEAKKIYKKIIEDFNISEVLTFYIHIIFRAHLM